MTNASLQGMRELWEADNLPIVETYGIDCPRNNYPVMLDLDNAANLAIAYMSMDVLDRRQSWPIFRIGIRQQTFGIDRYSLKCSACEEPTRGVIFDSAYLPESIFCSADCRDAAEFAAEQVR